MKYPQMFISHDQEWCHANELKIQEFRIANNKSKSSHFTINPVFLLWEQLQAKFEIGKQNYKAIEYRDVFIWKMFARHLCEKQ